MRRKLLLAALLFPLVGLMASIWSNTAQLSTASQWRIPVTGYDPRDPLRGRYIRFQYDWAVVGDARPCMDKGCTLCLEGDLGRVTVQVADVATNCPNRIDTAASDIHVSPRPRGTTGGFAFSSRIFVAESRAAELEKSLQSKPMVVIARLTKNGRLVNDRLQAAARSED